MNYAPWRPSLPHPPAHDEALDHVTQWLREHAGDGAELPTLSLRQLIHSEILRLRADEKERLERERGTGFSIDPDLRPNSGPYFDAAWELVRVGLLVPAISIPYGGSEFQLRDEFRVTERGRFWLQGIPDRPALPSEHRRFAAYLGEHDARFGDAYRLRAQEAIACYHYQCFYATCVMCGGAAEAIALRLAGARTGDPEGVARDMASAKGRKKVLDRLRQGRNSHEQEALEQYFHLVSWFRDDAAHASEVYVSEETAHLALVQLLRLASFAAGRWDALTKRDDQG